MIAIYFFVALIATSLGALVGLGGGVIIKPVLVTLAYNDLYSITVLSSLTVFSMSVVSLCLRYMRGLKLEKRTLLIGGGSIAGGLLGKSILQWFLGVVSAETATAVQSGFLLALLLLVLWLSLRKGNNLHLTHPFLVVLSGFILGLTSTFLGIGGGPINVALFLLLFSFTLDQAVVSSIFLIFLAQGTSLLATLGTGGFASADLSLAPYLVAGGITGAIAGTFLSSALDAKKKRMAFLCSIVAVILLNGYNMIMG